MRRRLLCLSMAALLLAGVSHGGLQAQIRLADESDRAAFRAWFAFLADAQYYRQTPDVTDCAALIRHAVREAFRAHTPEWIRRSRLPVVPPFPDVRHPPAASGGGWRLFRLSEDPHAAYGEFADARTLVRYNTRPVGRDLGGLRPGDLLYFRQPHQRYPDHLMVFVGPSLLEPEDRNWVVYHTGPSTAGQESPAAREPGEMRKVRLVDLLGHPAPHWRPLPGNPHFVGIFRLAWS